MFDQISYWVEEKASLGEIVLAAMEVIHFENNELEISKSQILDQPRGEFVSIDRKECNSSNVTSLLTIEFTTEWVITLITFLH